MARTRWTTLVVLAAAGPGAASTHLDVVHDVSATIVALARTPRTEVLWYDAVAVRDGVEVVRMRMMSRLLPT